jgi:hypothetical protein
LTRFIRITLEIPDGVEVQFGGSSEDGGGEPLPPPWWAAEDERPAAVRAITAGRAVPPAGSCPIHGSPWRTVPAGVSKKTGRPYAAFAACPELGCDERPAINRRTAS